MRFAKALVGVDRRTALGLGLFIPSSDELHQRIAGDVPFSSRGHDDGRADVGMAEESSQASMDEGRVVLDRGTLSLGMRDNPNSVKIVARIALVAIVTSPLSLLFVLRPPCSQWNDSW